LAFSSLAISDPVHFPVLEVDGRRATEDGHHDSNRALLRVDVLDGTVEVDIDGFDRGDGIHIGDDVTIHPRAVIEGPAVIADGCRIEAGARIGPYSMLGANVRVLDDADLERVVVHENTYLAPGVSLRGTVVGRACDLRKGVKADEGVVVGDECFIGEDASLAAGVKVYPFKTIESGAVVNQSIVWESRGARRLFGRLGVQGLANVDITPELATRMALAYGSTLKPGDLVVTSRDSSRSARMLKRAVHAGLNAAGVTVQDLEVAPLPVTRFIARRPAVAGAITIRMDDDDPQSVVIGFMDRGGADMDDNAHRKIERVFNREDFRRVFPAEIGDIDYVPRALEHYSAAIESTIDLDRIGRAELKLVVDFGYGSVAFVMPQLLAKLGADVLAVNPFAATPGVAVLERAAHAGKISDMVEASGSSLGVLFSPGGEQLTVVDETGRVLTDHQLMLALIDLRGDMEGARVALPVSAPAQAAALARRRGGDAILTATATAEIMAAAADPFVSFAADVDGRFIVPEFLPAFDAAATFAKLLDLLVGQDRSLADVVDGLDPVHMCTREVVTPWEQKGSVMRELVEQAKDREVDLVDGVRIHHDGGWVLVLPDPDEPVTTVTAEAESPDAAERLADEYIRRIHQLVRR